MTVRHMMVFRAVCDAGFNSTKAAELLHMTQPAVSLAIKELEQYYGIKLFDRLEKKILTNELDFALIEGIAHDSSIKSEAYMEDHLSIVCPANGKWKQGQIISVEEFKKQRFLLRERGSGTREVFERVIGQTGFTVSPVWEAMSTTALVNAVINELGIAVLPHRMVLPAMERGLVVTIGVDGMRFQRNFYIIHHKDKFLTASESALWSYAEIMKQITLMVVCFDLLKNRIFNYEYIYLFFV